jgi:hypothetical protein
LAGLHFAEIERRDSRVVSLFATARAAVVLGDGQPGRDGRAYVKPGFFGGASRLSCDGRADTDATVIEARRPRRTQALARQAGGP